jgi:hypothetical protein
MSGYIDRHTIAPRQQELSIHIIIPCSYRGWYKTTPQPGQQPAHAVGWRCLGAALPHGLYLTTQDMFGLLLLDCTALDQMIVLVRFAFPLFTLITTALEHMGSQNVSLGFT